MASYEEYSIDCMDSYYVRYVSAANSNLSTIATASSAASVVTATPITGNSLCGVDVTSLGRGSYSFVIHRTEVRFNVRELQKYGTVTLADNTSFASALRLTAGAAPTDPARADVYAYFTSVYDVDVDSYDDFNVNAISSAYDLNTGGGRSGTVFPNPINGNWQTWQPVKGIIEEHLNSSADIGIMMRHEYDVNHASATPTVTTMTYPGVWNNTYPPRLTLRVVPRTLYFGANF
jgi:hypothetical protein